MIGQPRIRTARVEDAAAIAKVHVETWRSTYAGLVPDGYLVAMKAGRQTAMWERLLMRSADTVVVVEESKSQAILGFGSCGPARAAPPPGYTGEIYTLYVAVDWQGQGLGQRLLAELLLNLHGRGAAAAYLWVLAENPTRFFYEAMGGQRLAERQEHFAGVQLDEIAYGWPNLAARFSSDHQQEREDE